MLAELGGFALIRRLRKPTPFAPASPSFKAEVSGGAGCLTTRKEGKKKKNKTKKTPETQLIILTIKMIINIHRWFKERPLKTD